MAAAKATPRKLPTWAWAAVGLAVFAAAYWYLGRGTALGNIDATASPPGQTDDTSAAQQPAGGAGNSAGNMPADLVSQPDTLQQQVQQTDTSQQTTSQAPTTSGIQAAYTPPPVITGGGYTPPSVIGGGGVAGGYVPPPVFGGGPTVGAGGTSNATRPGAQM